MDGHKMIHKREKVEGGWLTTWKCTECSREYQDGPDGHIVINKGQQLVKHYGFAATEVVDFDGFILSDIGSEKIDPRLGVFEEFFDKDEE